MGRTARTRRTRLSSLFVWAVFVALPVSIQAGGESADDVPHLTFRPTYEQALLEARVRGLPLFVSRHKDF